MSSEKDRIARFARLGIGADQAFDSDSLTPYSLNQTPEAPRVSM
jgi:hypothetical protein